MPDNLVRWRVFNAFVATGGRATVHELQAMLPDVPAADVSAVLAELARDHRLRLEGDRVEVSGFKGSR